VDTRSDRTALVTAVWSAAWWPANRSARPGSASRPPGRIWLAWPIPEPYSRTHARQNRPTW